MVSVVVSALNEEKNLRVTIDTIVKAATAVNKMPLDIIIVNDGSTDGTANVIRELEAKFPFVRSIHFPENRGIGAGIMESLKIAKYDKICNFPGDNACSPHIMKSLFAHSSEADFIISYLVNTEARGYKRHIISALYSFIYLFTFNLPVKYVNGSQLYPVALMRDLRLRSNRYSLLAETCIKLSKKPITFIEVADYIRHNQVKSSALRVKNFREVVSTYLRLIYEIYFRYRSEYRSKATRVLPKGEISDWVNEIGEVEKNESTDLKPIPVRNPESHRSSGAFLNH